jgi:hypothetical protein
MKYLFGLRQLPSLSSIVSIGPGKLSPYRVGITDFTDVEQGAARIKQWMTAHKLAEKRNVKACLAVDAICVKPEIHLEYRGEGDQRQEIKVIRGLNEAGTKAAGEHFKELVDNPGAFEVFVSENWENVIHAAFVYMVQPVEAKLESFILYVEPAVDGRASRKDEAKTLEDMADYLRGFHITIEIMFADEDSGYDALHQRGYAARISRDAERRGRSSIRKTNRRAMGCDPLHLLKRVRYRLLKEWRTVVGTSASSAELDLAELKRVLGSILPDVCFCDHPITKMHDKLPIKMFRFDVLETLYKEDLRTWYAYFYPWVLFNEAFYNEKASKNQRILWLRDADFYLLTYARALEENPAAAEELHFKNERLEQGSSRCMFDRNMVMHAINTINAVVVVLEEKEWNTKDLWLQRFGTVPVEKLFGRTRLHAGTHQTISAIVRVMERDQELKFGTDEHFTPEKRKSYGEIVYAANLSDSLLAKEQAVFQDESMSWSVALFILWSVGFETTEKLRQDILGRIEFDFEQFWRESVGECVHVGDDTHSRGRSLWKMMMGVSASGRTVTMRAKSETGRAIAPRKHEWFEEHFKRLLNGKKILKDHLAWVVQEVETMAHVKGAYKEETGRAICKSTRAQLMDWVEQRWSDVSSLIDAVLAAQDTPPPVYD